MPRTNIRKKFGRRIRQLRKEAMLSQEEMGFKANLHRTYIGSIERGEQNVSIDNVYKISKALKIKLKELFDF